MYYKNYFPQIPENTTQPPEQPFDPAADRLFERLDTLRHEAFALKNRLFRAPPEARPRLEQLLAENKAAQDTLCRALSQHNCIF